MKSYYRIKDIRVQIPQVDRNLTFDFEVCEGANQLDIRTRIDDRDNKDISPSPADSY